MPTTSNGRGSPPCKLRQLEPLRAGVAGAAARSRACRPCARRAARTARPLASVLLGGVVPVALRQAGLARGQRASRGGARSLRVPGQHVGVALEPLDAHLPARLAAGRRSPCTWRSVTGSIASAPRARRTPKGAAANLAIGGASPVATLQREARGIGQRAAGVVLQPGRQLDREARRSRAAASGSASSLHLVGLVVLVEHRRERRRRRPASAAPAAASARGTGAEKRSVIGRIGRQGALGTLALAAELGREGACARGTRSAARRA